MISTLKENAEIILPQNGLEDKLQQAGREQRKLIIKLGFDPTAPDLHLGHAVVLKKLRQFQDLGHQVVIIVGSFTARIGDPTGKNKARKPLTAAEVQHHAETYISQLAKVIDVEKTKIVFNSEWLDALPFPEVIRLMSHVTVAQLMQRNDFSKRFAEKTPISIHELMYPVLQGFDSVQTGCDIEIGGTDQLFNCTMGRQLQESHGKPPQTVLCMPLLRGIDGKEKMSKSLNNTIGLTDGPNEMFGKIMSVPDTLIEEYIDLTTDFPAEEKECLKKKLESGENPMVIKKRIAGNVVAQYHDAEAEKEARKFFARQFQNKNFEEKVFQQVDIRLLPHHRFRMTLADLCHQLKSTESKSFIRRLIQNNGVTVDTLRKTDPAEEIELVKGTRIRIGRRSFFELQ